jgi:hypothetical protein
MLAAFAVIALLLMRISECAFFPGFCRFRIRKLSNGIVSALPDCLLLVLVGDDDDAADAVDDMK